MARCIKIIKIIIVTLVIHSFYSELLAHFPCVVGEKDQVVGKGEEGEGEEEVVSSSSQTIEMFSKKAIMNKAKQAQNFIDSIGCLYFLRLCGTGCLGTVWFISPRIFKILRPLPVCLC